MGLFTELRRAKELGLNLTTVLVKAYLEEHGPSPVGQIAKACATSIRSVERAIALLKTLNFFYNQKTTSMSHDHDKHYSRREGTASEVTGVSAAAGGSPAGNSADAGVSDRHREDPLAMKLLAAEVLPWCVDILLAKVDRAVIERQLTYHAHRLETGFTFKAHPAKFLFRACLNDYMPPVDYFAAKQRPAAPVAAEAEAPAPAPAPEPPAAMTRSGALTVIRMGVRSKLPTMREQAVRLAVEWDIDLREFGADAGLLAEAEALRTLAG